MGTILVIDDDAQVRALLRTTLEFAGHEVEEAPDGEIGMRLFCDNPTDLVITDIFMPEREGLETIQELRRSFPETKIIAISGGGRLKDPGNVLQMARMFGASWTFSKPIDRDVLLDVVRELVSEAAL